MGIYFILWVIMQSYFIFLLRLLQLWPLGALSAGPQQARLAEEGELFLLSTFPHQGMWVFKIF